MKVPTVNITSEETLAHTDMYQQADDTNTDLLGMYAPYAGEPKAEGNSPEPVYVAKDEENVEIIPDPGIIKIWDGGVWYKELVIRYFVIECLPSDNNWIEVVWNNMGRRYNAFLKSINTKRRTLRFSVLNEEDFRRLNKKADDRMNELQTEMLKGTSLNGFVLKEVVKADTQLKTTYTDSELETDSIYSSSLSLGEHDVGHTIIRAMKRIGTDLREMKQFLLDIHKIVCVKESTPRRTYIPKRFKKQSLLHNHTPGFMSNIIHEHMSTSTDEDGLEMTHDSATFEQADQRCLSLPDPPGQPIIDPYKSVMIRNRRSTKNKFTTFQLQESPGCPIKYDRYESGHWQKMSTGPNDDDVDEKCFKTAINKQRVSKPKRKLGQSKRNEIEHGHPDLLLRSPDSFSPGHRSGLKVLTPRPAKTGQEQQSTKSNATDRESPKTKSKEGTIMGINHVLTEVSFQTPAVEPQQKDLLLQTDKRQEPDEDLAIKDQHRQRDTERHENAKSGKISIEDKELLDKIILKMEKRGDVNLETDGINDPSLLSQIFSENKQGVTSASERIETVKKGKDDVAIAEAAPHQEQGTHAVMKSQEQEGDASEVSCSTSFTGSRMTDTTESTDVCDLEVEIDGSTDVSTIPPPGDPEWSDYSSLPSIDAESMLQTVGLDTNTSLIQLLNKNKKSIEDSSQEAKGNGIDTVLLVDASSSMDDKSMEQIKSACFNFVEFVETVAAEKNIEENLALVVFGRNPMILQHLTTDYRKLYDKIENIEPGGSSPFCLGTLLSMMELHLKGGTTSIARYQIPPRVIMWTDGRPTDDCRFQHQEIEFAVKSPTVKENVLLAMDEMRHHGYKVVCIPVGQAINRTFIADMVGRADGSIVEIDDLSSIKKHFLLQYTIAKVIGVSRDTASESKYQKVIRKETAGLIPSTLEGVSFTEADVTLITTELEKSEELNDIEYPDLNLPSIGSRVSIPADPMSSHSGNSKEYGTVIQQKSTGTIKVEWDAGMFTFVAYKTDKTKLRLNIEPEPRRLSKGSLIEAGVEVIKVPTAAEIESDTLRGRVFLTTSNGFVKVRWADGTIGRYKYGADATFELYIVLESYAFNAYVWQYQEGDGKWITYPLDNQQKLESAYMKRSKTATTRTSRSSGRIKFADMTETHTHGDESWEKRPVRRITVAEMITNFV